MILYSRWFFSYRLYKLWKAEFGDVLLGISVGMGYGASNGCRGPRESAITWPKNVGLFTGRNPALGSDHEVFESLGLVRVGSGFGRFSHGPVDSGQEVFEF